MRISRKISREIGYEELLDYPLKLRDTINVPIDGGGDVDFSVVHIKANDDGSDTVYFVADKIVGESSMFGMDRFLSDFEKKMPKELADMMEWQEHSRYGYETRRRLTIPSYGNVGIDSCIGKDDIQFDGLSTRWDRVRSFENGDTSWWWLDSPQSRSPIVSTTTNFGFVNGNGSLNYSGASSTYGVVFGFSIKTSVNRG